MIRLPSRLDDETENCIFETMQCGFAVHKAIGPGFGERIYKNAFCVELLARKTPFETEQTFVVKYREQPVGTHRLDLVVRERVLVELKAVKMLKTRPRGASNRLSKGKRTPCRASDEFRRRHAEGRSPADRRVRGFHRVIVLHRAIVVIQAWI